MKTKKKPQTNKQYDFSEGKQTVLWILYGRSHFLKGGQIASPYIFFIG